MAIVEKQDLEVEMRLLGTLIGIGQYYDKICYEIFTMLTEDSFHNIEHKELYHLLLKLNTDKLPFDMISILSLAPSHLFALIGHLSKDSYYSTNHYKQDIERLTMLKSLRPRIHELSVTFKNCVNENDPFICDTLLNEGISRIAAYSNNSNLKYCETYEEMIDEILSMENEPFTEVKTRLLTWPAFPMPSLITIAGRSGTGKTYLGLYLMEQIASAMPERQILYFNLEMQKEQLLLRHAKMLGYTEPSLRQTIKSAAGELLKRNISFINRPLLTIDEIELIVRAQSMKKVVSLIVVDYIGLVRCKQRFERKDLEQGEIAQRLSALAIENKCIVMALLQVNRDHKNRGVGNKCPETTDAAESIACERSSEWWLGIDQPQIDTTDRDYQDLFIIKNRKSRGEHGYFNIYMTFKNGRFSEIHDQMAIARMLDAKTKPTKSHYFDDK
jgi:replicative DNA helicase